MTVGMPSIESRGCDGSLNGESPRDRSGALAVIREEHTCRVLDPAPYRRSQTEAWLVTVSGSRRAWPR